MWDRFRSRIERLRRFVLETVHGVRIGPRLFVGLGVAWNYYSARGDMPDDSFREYTDGGRSFVPIFADMKVYFLDRRISPYLKWISVTASTSTAVFMLRRPSV